MIQICEIYYFPLEERALASNPWDGIPGAHLPSRLCFNTIQHPSDKIIFHCGEDVREYHNQIYTLV